MRLAPEFVVTLSGPVLRLCVYCESDRLEKVCPRCGNVVAVSRGCVGTALTLALMFCYRVAGETAAVPVLHQCEGEGVADGVSDPLHQGYRRPARERGASGGPEERRCKSMEL